MNSAPAETVKGRDVKAPDDDKLAPDSDAQIGEGSYEGTRRYAEGIQSYLADADVAKDAAEAAPASSAEADVLEQAEATAAARSRAPGK